MAQMCEMVRSKCGDDLPISVWYEDQACNEWTSLFLRLDGDTQGIQQQPPTITQQPPAAAPDSGCRDRSGLLRMSRCWRSPGLPLAPACQPPSGNSRIEYAACSVALRSARVRMRSPCVNISRIRRRKRCGDHRTLQGAQPRRQSAHTTVSASLRAPAHGNARAPVLRHHRLLSLVRGCISLRLTRIPHHG